MTSRTTERIKHIMDQKDTYLEPRVAKLEAGLDILTKNVTELTTAVRDVSTNLESKIERLTVAVTEAQAPKKTDWSVIISAMLLVMAIGSAVFWPLNQTSQNTKFDVQTLTTKFEEHEKLTLHPVGQAKIDALGKLMDERENNYLIQHKPLDDKIQRETQLMTELISTRLSDLDMRLQKEFALRGDLIDQRLTRLEQYKVDMLKMDQDELRNWRLQKMGGPLVSSQQSTSQAFPSPQSPSK